MKTRLLIIFCFLSFQVFSQVNYCGYVNPFIGTGGHGHTFPGATVPFGMVQLSPDTRIDGSWDGCGGYHYSDSILYGFSHTHLSGTGCSDYGDILLFPVSEKFSPDKKYSSHYSHAMESASPGYYSVFLDDQHVKTEFTTSERTGFHQYTFPNGNDSAGVLIDLRHRDLVLDAELFQSGTNKISGFRRSSAWAKDQLLFFHIEFSEPVKIDFIHSDSAITGDTEKGKSYRGNIYAFLKFKLPQDKIIKIKVALSSVDTKGAAKNMKTEIPGWDFLTVKTSAEKKWNNELGKIEVSGGTEEQYKIFYTALYHCMVVPNIYNDVDGKYRGRDSEIHTTKTVHYTVFSLWDTFRAWHPLMTIIDPTRTLDYVKTFLRQYEQAGMLPVWELSSNETECMIGYHSVSVIADAFMKGINNFNTDVAIHAMITSAETKERFGLGSYMDHGYLDVLDESESVSKTLEYAYDDWCIAQFAKAIDRNDIYKIYMKRSNHWQNLFDTKNKFIRPKKNGGWYKPFDPHEVNNNYTEANAWQYTFFVPHDIRGLTCRMGGKTSFEKKLDELFSTDSKTTGRDQADITGLIGQYAQGNEPSHHMAFLYNYTDHPWKTQQLISGILNDMYHANPDGLIGNEDCGEMSAWFVMSAMGLYQVCPGNPVYDLTTPLFSNIKINLENGRSIQIKKVNGSKENQFIQSVKVNDELNGLKLNHSQLMKGGEIDFLMGKEKIDEPEKQNTSFPGERIGYSDCLSGFIASPIINFESSIFKEFADVSISADTGMKIYYTINGKSPDTSSLKYTKPFRVDSTTTLKAFAFNPHTNSESYITSTHFNKMLHPDWRIKIVSKYSSQYSAGGDDGIIDGIYADEDWRKGGWQGYQGQDFEAVVDFGKEINVNDVSARFLQDVRSWIFMPAKVEFEISDDGNVFKQILSVNNTFPDTESNNTIKNYGGKVSAEKGRYLKVKAKNYGKLPSWHPGAGGDAYIFIDEIIVE